MGESFKEFCKSLRNYFSNTVYIKDINLNNPVDFSVREIKIEGEYLVIDGKKIALSQLSENHIIIINGSVEKIENCKNVFVAEDVNLITNADNVICNNIEGSVFSEKIEASEIIGDVSCHTLNCKNIDGNIKAQGSVKCHDVSEHIFTLGDINLEKGNIGGDVQANNINIMGDINGNVICKGDLTQKGTIEGDFYESFAK